MHLFVEIIFLRHFTEIANVYFLIDIKIEETKFQKKIFFTFIIIFTIEMKEVYVLY